MKDSVVIYSLSCGNQKRSLKNLLYIMKEQIDPKSKMKIRWRDSFEFHKIVVVWMMTEVLFVCEVFL